jgi:predicted CXXCH cytochrome family protein
MKGMSPRNIVIISVVLVYASLVAAASGMSRLPTPAQEEKRQTLDPAAWGSNHVGKPIPEYVRGDECLFCHRNDIGTTWGKTSHGTTLRQREEAPELSKLLQSQAALSGVAGQVQFFLGSRSHVRFLKKEGFGKLSLLSARADLRPDHQLEKLVGGDKPTWDKDRVANQCAGCHATAVDPSTRAITLYGLDCSTCHGDVSLDHTKDTSLIWLSKKRRNDAKAVTSICAQCHLRGGKSKSTGLPYANNFIAGDNLFQDYTADFARADDESLNPGDRHVWRNVREVVLYGVATPTCLSCHDVHNSSSVKHRRLPRTAMCADCHTADGPYKPAKSYTVSNQVCDY